jgi:hypothetical protein
MVIVPSCEQQHEHLIVAWKSLHSSLAFVCYSRRSLQYDNKERLSHRHRRVVASRSILSLALHAFAIVDVIDPYRSKGLVVAGAISRAPLLQSTLLVTSCARLKRILSSLKFFAIRHVK